MLVQESRSQNHDSSFVLMSSFAWSKASPAVYIRCPVTQAYQFSSCMICSQPSSLMATLAASNRCPATQAIPFHVYFVFWQYCDCWVQSMFYASWLSIVLLFYLIKSLSHRVIPAGYNRSPAVQHRPSSPLHQTTACYDFGTLVSPHISRTGGVRQEASLSASSSATQLLSLRAHSLPMDVTWLAVRRTDPFACGMSRHLRANV